MKQLTWAWTGNFSSDTSPPAYIYPTPSLIAASYGEHVDAAVRPPDQEALMGSACVQDRVDHHSVSVPQLRHG